MTTRYVGAGGNDANSGLSWAQRKLTLNGVEDTPVVAGDQVWVGPGTYRELLTVDVSGTAGNPVIYSGDYTGANTDGVGGVVRITGSDNDITVTRANCISAAASRSYRTFRGFYMHLTSGNAFNWTNGSNVTVEQCSFEQTVNAAAVSFAGAALASHVVDKCYFVGFSGTSSQGVVFTHTGVLDDTACIVRRCIFNGMGGSGVVSNRIGGVSVLNSVFLRMTNACVQIGTALTVGQTVTVNNNIMYRSSSGLTALSVGEITEDYNAFFGNSTNRSNTSTGANSNAYPFLADQRWFFQAAIDSGTLVTPFDLASYCGLVELNSGTGAPSTDLRGASATGSFREWGPLEYNAALAIEAGGGVTMWPLSQSFIQGIIGAG